MIFKINAILNCKKSKIHIFYSVTACFAVVVLFMTTFVFIEKASAHEKSIAAIESLNAEIAQINEEIKEQQQQHCKIDNLIKTAKSFIGASYLYGGATPAGFDCSGFTMYCYKQLGIDLPHNAAAQISCGNSVSSNNLQPGDLVFFGKNISHVGIYVGNGKFIHSPRTGEFVRIDSLDARLNYAGACRIL